jgi:hypothetical protein
VLFPDNPAEQSRYMAAVVGFCLTHPALPTKAAMSEVDKPAEGSIPVSHGSAAAVLMRHGGPRAAHARGFDDYQALIQESQGKAFTAGALLTLLYRLTLHSEFRDRASINIAAYVLEKERPFPDIMAANRKDIFAAWTRYKPVAHFCGALLNLHLSAMRAHDVEEERREFISTYLFDRTQEFV